jgi:hypothetical protein
MLRFDLRREAIAQRIIHPRAGAREGVGGASSAPARRSSSSSGHCRKMPDFWTWSNRGRREISRAAKPTSRCATTRPTAAISMSP